MATVLRHLMHFSPAGEQENVFSDKKSIDMQTRPLVNSAAVTVYKSGNNSVVECNLAKVEVASSNLVSRSKETPRFGRPFEPFFFKD